MADDIKVLAQADPLAATLTDAYTVPSGVATIISSIVVCNRGAATSFRISVAVAGAVDTNKQYLFYDTAIAANTTTTVVIGVSLSTADKVRVLATLATLSFNIFGIEVSA